MIILDHPCVSEFLMDTVAEMQVPVLKNEMSAGISTEKKFRLLEEAEFIESVKEQGICPLYSNSENSIAWIAENLAFTGLPEKIEFFKNRVRFRELHERIYPEFRFQAVDFDRETGLLVLFKNQRTGF